MLNKEIEINMTTLALALKNNDEKAGVKAAMSIAIGVLTDINRIANALEKIADAPGVQRSVA